MDEDLGKPSGLSCPDFPPHSLTEVKNSRPDDEPPAEVSEAMFRRVEGESRNEIGVYGVSDETASSMRVKCDHEEKCEVVGVPKCLKALSTDLVVSGRVHYDHDK